MKRRRLNCEHCYMPMPGNERIDNQSCCFGLKDGGSPVGEYCPMDGKRLQNLRKGGKQ